MELLETMQHDEKVPHTFRYQAVKLYHPVAGVSYGIEGEWTDENGKKVGSVLWPDISCDYLLVSRLAAKCTAAQLDPDHLQALLGRIFI